MGAGAAAGGVTGIIGGLIGQNATKRANRGAKRAMGNQSLSNTYDSLIDLLTPYDELVAMGRVAPGQAWFSEHGGESRFSTAVGGGIKSLAAADPVFAQYQKAIEGGLAGLSDGNLPDDFRRTLLEEVRGSQAGRGIVDSDTSAIEEAARLMGGHEAIRASRLGEAQNYLSGITGNLMQALMPALNPVYTGDLQKAFKSADNMFGAVEAGTRIFENVNNNAY